MQLKIAADALISLSPIILMLTLCLSLLITPVSRREEPAIEKDKLRINKELERPPVKPYACHTDPALPCFL